MLGLGWESQWRRVQKGLKQMEAVYSGLEGGTEDALDVVCSFFQAAHHLKDWLGNDPSTGVSTTEFNRLINGSPMLQICADLANGAKHLALTSARTGDRSTTIGRNDVNVDVTAGTVAHRFYVQSRGTEYDVLEIAHATVGELTVFLTGKGLLD